MNSKESSEDILQRARNAMAKKNTGTARRIVEEIKKVEAAMNETESVDYDASIIEPAESPFQHRGEAVEIKAATYKNDPAAGVPAQARKPTGNAEAARAEIVQEKRADAMKVHPAANQQEVQATGSCCSVM